MITGQKVWKSFAQAAGRKPHSSPKIRSRANPFKVGGQGRHGSQGPWLRGEVKPGGKADAPKDAKSILLKALLWLPNGTQNAVCQISLPSKGICQPPMGIVGHGVDGEIPAGQVFPEAFFQSAPSPDAGDPGIPLRCERW